MLYRALSCGWQAGQITHGSSRRQSAGLGLHHRLTDLCSLDLCNQVQHSEQRVDFRINHNLAILRMIAPEPISGLRHRRPERLRDHERESPNGTVGKVRKRLQKYNSLLYEILNLYLLNHALGTKFMYKLPI